MGGIVIFVVGYGVARAFTRAGRGPAIEPAPEPVGVGIVPDDGPEPTAAA